MATSQQGAPSNFGGAVYPQTNPPTVQQGSEDDQPTEKLTAGKFNADNATQPRLTRAANTPAGLISSGNTDITTLPADAKFTSYESSDGKETLISVPRGFTPAQAITLHQDPEGNHSHLGVFDSPENARAAEAIKLVPRGQGGAPVYIAPVLRPQAGRTHDAVQFPTGEIFHLPAELSDDSKNKIAQIIHSHLVNPTQK